MESIIKTNISKENMICSTPGVRPPRFPILAAKKQGLKQKNDD